MPLHAPDDSVPVVNGVQHEDGHANRDETILTICTDIANRINKFLEEDAPTPLLKQVQAQTRVALGVITSALERYG